MLTIPVHDRMLTLAEGSYTASNVPGMFWLVFDIGQASEKYAKQVASGRLKGLKGISGDRRIVGSWLGVARNAMLVMPGKDVIKLNKLSRVLYDNPEYLASQDFKALYRLYNQTNRSQLMMRIVDRLKPHLKRSTHPSAGDLHHVINHGWLSGHVIGNHYEKAKPRIQSVSDAAKYLKRAVAETGLASVKDRFGMPSAALPIIKEFPLSEWKKVVAAALTDAGKLYQDEGEWTVKGDTFHIPKNSNLVILRPATVNRGDIEAYWAKGEAGIRERHDGKVPSPQTLRHFLNLLDVIKKAGLHKGPYRVKFADEDALNRGRFRLRAA